MQFSIYRSALATLAATLILLSCKGGDDYEYDTTGNSIVTNVVIGRLNRVMPTLTADGRDSTYIVNVVGSYYPMTIDQLRGTICNLDSLPIGTDISKVVFSSFECTGRASIKSLTTGEDTIFTTTDSIDFTQPRIVTTHATDGISTRSYIVELRVHKEWPDSTTWTRGGVVDELKTMSAGVGCVEDGTLNVFARLSDGPYYVTAPAHSLEDWAFQPIGDSNLDVRSVRRMNGKWYGLSSGQLVESSNGIDWSSDGMQATHYTHLVAAASSVLFATDGEEIFSSTDNGKSWIKDQRESGALPKAGVSGVAVASTADPTQERIYFVGTQNGRADVWCRTIDMHRGETYPWMRITDDNQAGNACPLLDNYTLLPYDGGLLLMGEAAGNLSSLYMSYDGGHTWNPKTMKRPNVMPSSSVCGIVGNNGTTYILLGGSGERWHGRINRLGWKDVPTSFTLNNNQ